MGELQHGFYDDECDGLMYDEINVLHGFGDEGELIDKDDDQDDSELEDLESRSCNNEEITYVDIEVRFFFNY